MGKKLYNQVLVINNYQTLDRRMTINTLSVMKGYYYNVEQKGHLWPYWCNICVQLFSICFYFYEHRLLFFLYETVTYQVL